MHRDRFSPLGLLVAVLFIFMWATSFVPSRIAALEAPPLWFLIARFSTAAVIFFAIAFSRRMQWPSSLGRWATLAGVGIFGHATYLGLTYIALEHMSSALGAIIASTNPLIVAIVAPWLLAERLTLRKTAGLLLGFGGVVLIMLARTGLGTARPHDAVLAFIGVIALVISTLLFKRMQNREALPVVNAVGFTTAALVLMPVAFLSEGLPHVAVGPPLVASFAWLVVVLSVGTTLLWFWLLSHQEASRVSAYFFLAPVFGVTLGAAILHEAMVPRDMLGIVCIVAGLYLVSSETVLEETPIGSTARS